MENSTKKDRIKYSHKVELHLCEMTGTPIGYIVTTPNGYTKFMSFELYERLNKRFEFRKNK